MLNFWVLDVDNCRPNKGEAKSIEATSVEGRGVMPSLTGPFSERRSAGNNFPPGKWCYRAAKLAL
jgi:hypothetical protein